MSSRTGSHTNTVNNYQGIRQESQEPPTAFNKRSAKSISVQATPSKSRKLSHADTAARRVSADMPAKSLAPALRRRQMFASGEASLAVEVPARKATGKVRFLEQGSIHGSHVFRKKPLENTGPSGHTIQVVVPSSRTVDGSSRDQASNNVRQEIESVADYDGTDLATTTQIENPRTLIIAADADFKSCYLQIKSLAWTWVQHYFSDVSPEAKRCLDLLHLAHNSPQLMEYANWISCCGKICTWEDVFNNKRALLVYGILGKMLEVHVFGHEMFGADKDQLRELRELDLELVNRDGLYRQKCRAHKILAFLPDARTLPLKFHQSLTALHASFVELLFPLLPSPLPPQLQPQLLAILLKAATLSLSMRRERNVVYHWETHPAVGSLFESESMHILNDGEHQEEDKGRSNTDMELVMMAGWPSCVAYRPNTTGDRGMKTRKSGEKVMFGVHRIARAEVCVSFGPVIKPLSVEPEKWLGRRLRVEITARDEAKRAKDKKDKKAAAAKVAGLGLAGFGVTVSAILGLKYAVG